MGDSQKCGVRKNKQQELEFYNDTSQFYPGQVFLDFNLETSTNYVIHVKFEQTKQQCKCFYCGIIPASQKDTDWGDDQMLCYSEQKGNCGINTIIKGKPILTEDNQLTTRSLEVRINIQRRILKVGSLPNYDSVVEADEPERINPTTPYRFILEGLDQGTMISITKLVKVIEFDDNM